MCAPGGGTADGWDDPTSDEAAADGDNSATDTGSGLAARLLGPVGGQITFGTVTGFCSGYALKQMGRTAAYFVGIAFIFVQVRGWPAAGSGAPPLRPGFTQLPSPPPAAARA